MEAPVEVTSVEAFTTSMEACMESFVEATSMEAFAKVSLEACGFVCVKASIASMEAMESSMEAAEACTEAFMSFRPQRASSAGDRKVREICIMQSVCFSFCPVCFFLDTTCVRRQFPFSPRCKPPVTVNDALIDS